MRIFILSLITGCLFINNVWADHEADHRYNVRGYVLDASEDAIKNQLVQVFAEGQLLGTGRTGSDGYYSMHLHLHNSDLNRALKLQAGKLEAEIRVQFDASDKTSVRIHDANFIDGKYVAGSLQRLRIPSWIYAVIVVIGIVLVAFFLEKRRKKKIRLAKYGPADGHAASAHKSRKPKRKKH